MSEFSMYFSAFSGPQCCCLLVLRKLQRRGLESAETQTARCRPSAGERSDE
jgi:hypothetical protein